MKQGLIRLDKRLKDLFHNLDGKGKSEYGIDLHDLQTLRTYCIPNTFCSLSFIIPTSVGKRDRSNMATGLSRSQNY